MKVNRYLLKILDSIRGSFWFLPSLMTILSMVLSVVAVGLDSSWGDEWVRQIPWLYLNEPDGARALLSTIAGSVITVAGVTFSMTLLSFSHASSQIGPRILSGLMEDRGNQFTLGIFISTFVFCFLVLRSVGGSLPGAGQENGNEAFVPHLSILIAITLT